MGKSKTTKSDGVKDFSNTQNLGDQKRISRGAGKQNNFTSNPK